MRRSLVICDETARHPFRASLPPHFRAGQTIAPPSVRAWRQALTFTRDDVRGFATTYVSCLVAAAAFLF